MKNENNRSEYAVDTKKIPIENASAKLRKGSLAVIGSNSILSFYFGKRKAFC
jgi:hypothetical protein